MSFFLDVLDLVAAEVTHLGLSEDGVTEYSGGDYAPLPVTWEAAAEHEGNPWVFADDVPYTFYGVNEDEVTHLILKRDGDADMWLFVELGSSAVFNESDALLLTRAGFTSSMLVPTPDPEPQE